MGDRKLWMDQFLYKLIPESLVRWEDAFAILYAVIFIPSEEAIEPQ
jgi:hypothetical protein